MAWKTFQASKGGNITQAGHGKRPARGIQEVLGESAKGKVTFSSREQPRKNSVTPVRARNEFSSEQQGVEDFLHAWLSHSRKTLQRKAALRPGLKVRQDSDTWRLGPGVSERRRFQGREGRSRSRSYNTEKIQSQPGSRSHSHWLVLGAQKYP